MHANERTAGVPNMSARLSLFWIFILFNMVFADILSFMYPGFLKEVLTEIPIAMIVLSRVLRRGVNRWANIVAAVITIAYVAGGSTRSPHGIFLSAVQVACALLIVWSAWKWRSPEAAVIPPVVAFALGTLPVAVLSI